MTKIRKIVPVALAACVCAAAAIGIHCCAGCASTDAERAAVKAEVASVMRLAYDAGAKDAVAKRIDELAAEGKITEAQAEVLHRAAQAAYEHALSRLEGGTPAATNCTAGACAPATNCVDSVCADPK